MSELTVTRLLTSPIKGLRMNEPTEVMLDRGGAVGDRDFLLVDETDRIRSVTVVGALLRMRAHYAPDTGRLSIVADEGRSCDGVVELGESVTANAMDVKFVDCHEVVGSWSEFVSDVVGQRLRLVKVDKAGMGSDVAPVTLLGTGSLEELSRRSGLTAVDPRRFRMLIELGPCPPHAEDTWEGHTVTVGSASLKVGAKVPRCAATTRHPERGDRDESIVRMIKAYRGVHETGWGTGVPFGVYAEVVHGGRVRRGDAVHVHG
ncbi:MAG TPA: MOSC domain-containing protein [Solirubrobacteraceae bacterium]|nr:MOSC domain-containing protein [Solirubrobacteraceae bacterium]